MLSVPLNKTISSFLPSRTWCNYVVKHSCILMVWWVIRSIPYCGPIMLFLVPASAPWYMVQLYGVKHMLKNHSDSQIGNLLPPLYGVLFPISSKGFYMHHLRDRIAHIMEQWLEYEITQWVCHERLIQWPIAPWELWHVLSFLWDGACKRSLAGNQKE